jgi:hypothetical protein
MNAFFGHSLRRRRALRWLHIFYVVMLALFIDTLFFQIFYPDNGFCENYNDTVSCESLTNSVTGSSVCTWKPESNLVNGGKCTLAPPPTSFIFSVILALVTVIIILPIKLLADIIIDEYATKRADFSRFGISSDLIFGSATWNIGKDNKKPIEYLPDDIDLSKEQFEDIVFQGKQSLFDLNTAAEEVDVLFRSIRDFLVKSYAHGYIPWRDAMNKSYKHNHQAVEAILDKLGIYPDGTARPLTLRQRLLFESPYDRLVAKIQSARDRADQMLTDLSGFSDVEDHLKNEYVIQSFILG